MKRICKTSLITSNNCDNFHNSVGKIITEYQTNGYEVEVQYGVAIDMNFTPLHSAFIIAREGV